MHKEIIGYQPYNFSSFDLFHSALMYITNTALLDSPFTNPQFW